MTTDNWLISCRNLHFNCNYNSYNWPSARISKEMHNTANYFNCHGSSLLIAPLTSVLFQMIGGWQIWPLFLRITDQLQCSQLSLIFEYILSWSIWMEWNSLSTLICTIILVRSSCFSFLHDLMLSYDRNIQTVLISIILYTWFIWQWF